MPAVLSVYQNHPLFFGSAGMETVVVDKVSKAQNLLESAHKTPSLKLIIIFEKLTNNNLTEAAQKSNIDVVGLDSLMVRDLFAYLKKLDSEPCIVILFK